MRYFFWVCIVSVCLATPLAAQPVEFDPADFGKIVVAARQSAGGGGIVLEQAFGDYQNEPVTDYGANSIARRLGRPVGRLDVLYNNGKTGYCTAFIVDDQHLVTNHHCIPGLNGTGVQAAQFVTGYLTSGQGDDAEKFQVATQPVETSANLDYSVLRVFGDPSARYGTVELANADPEPSEFLWIIGHPQGQVQHISREGCAAADPAVSGEGKVVHSCDTLGGNSGSPVFRVTDRQVVALHHAGDSRTGFNFAIPMTRILKNSKVLKAKATVAPPTPPTPVVQDDCLVLWTAAQQHGCLGYQTFVTQCGSHPLAALARGLADRACAAVDVAEPGNPTTDPGKDTDKPDVLAPAPGFVEEALETARTAQSGVQRGIVSAQADLQRMQSLVQRAERITSTARRVGDATGVEEARLWEALGRRFADDLAFIRGQTEGLTGLADDMAAAVSVLLQTPSQEEATDAANRIADSTRTAQKTSEGIAARRIAAERALQDTETQVAVLREKARELDREQVEAEAALRARVEAGLRLAATKQTDIAANTAAAQVFVDRFAALLAEAFALAREAQQDGGPASGDIASLWQGFARDVAGKAGEARREVQAMSVLRDEIDAAVLALDKAKDEAQVTRAIRRIEAQAEQAGAVLSQVVARYAEADGAHRTTQAKAATLRKAAVPPEVVTRCLTVSMPQFAVPGIAGVPTADFDANAAELACTAARRVSDDPAVLYGLARAIYQNKRHREATTMLREAPLQSYVPAMYHLGVAYNTGRGVTKDFDAALDLYRKTSEAGYPQGKFSLGVYYSLGRAVRADHARAASLLVEAIADGYSHPISQLHKLPNATIREMQRILVSRGVLAAGGVDGAFGPGTRGALERIVGTNQQ